MTHKQNRRRFIKTTAAASAAGAGFFASSAPRVSRAANEQIAFACIGIGGKGSSDSADAEKNGDIVAICDIDQDRLDGAGKKEGFTKAKSYNDWRKMIDEMADSIDAITVSLSLIHI